MVVVRGLCKMFRKMRVQLKASNTPVHLYNSRVTCQKPPIRPRAFPAFAVGGGWTAVARCKMQRAGRRGWPQRVGMSLDAYKKLLAWRLGPSKNQVQQVGSFGTTELFPAGMTHQIQKSLPFLLVVFFVDPCRLRQRSIRAGIGVYRTVIVHVRCAGRCAGAKVSGHFTRRLPHLLTCSVYLCICPFATSHASTWRGLVFTGGLR